jgi:hypothetical protein
MSRGLGRIGRVILSQIEHASLLDPITGKRGMAPISSWDLAYNVYRTGYDFTPAQRKAVTRSMHSFVRRYPQFALAGGQGRIWLYLYEPDDPLSVKWMRLKLTNHDSVTNSATPCPAIPPSVPETVAGSRGRRPALDR